MGRPHRSKAGSTRYRYTGAPTTTARGAMLNRAGYSCSYGMPPAEQTKIAGTCIHLGRWRVRVCLLSDCSAWGTAGYCHPPTAQPRTLTVAADISMLPILRSMPWPWSRSALDESEEQPL